MPRNRLSAVFVCVPLACVQLLYLCLCFRPLAFQAFIPPCVATVRMNIPHTPQPVNRILDFFLDFFAFFFVFRDGGGRVLHGQCQSTGIALHTPALREPQGPHFESPLEAALRVPGTGRAVMPGLTLHLCKVKCRLLQIPNQVRDDGFFLLQLPKRTFVARACGCGVAFGMTEWCCRITGLATISFD